MYRYYYNKEGTIVRKFKLTKGFEFIHEGSYVDAEEDKDINLWRYEDSEFKKITVEPVEHSLPFYQRRRNSYGTAEQQLALLWDDVDKGLYGDAAKQGLWYKHCQRVKKENAPDR